MVRRDCKVQSWAGQLAVKVYLCKVFIFHLLIIVFSPRSDRYHSCSAEFVDEEVIFPLKQNVKKFRGGCSKFSTAELAKHCKETAQLDTSIAASSFAYDYFDYD